MWIELDGAVNVRDVGGLPLPDGGEIAQRRLIRSDNLQDLTERDVRRLVDDLGVRAVVDLRTLTEVTSEGPGPLSAELDVQIVHLSLYTEDGTVAVRETDAGPVILPWQDAARDDKRSASWVYDRYLTNRSDSVLAALRLIATSPGSTVVHCAAGKDRTGVIVALALAAVGVPDDAIVADYASTTERMPLILARLAASPTYADTINVDEPDKHAPRPHTMREFLLNLGREHGGVPGWLKTQGWTDADQQALVAKLTG